MDLSKHKNLICILLFLLITDVSSILQPSKIWNQIIKMKLDSEKIFDLRRDIHRVDLSSTFDLTLDIVADHVHAKVDPKYLSFCADSAVANRGSWDNFILTRQQTMITLMKALSPAYLRFGGTSADHVVFTQSTADKIADLGLNPHMIQMNATAFDQLINITRGSDLRLLFELNLQVRYGMQWDPTNAIELLDYLSSKSYGENIDWELGNEPDWYHNHPEVQTFNGSQIAKAYMKLRTLLNKYPVFKNCVLVGPDTGSASAYSYHIQMFKDFLHDAGHIINATTFHQYYFHGNNAKVNDYIDPKYFAVFDDYINRLKTAVEKSVVPDIPLWIGETSDSNIGGTPGISDKYASSFYWLDKLGRAAEVGVKLLMRQTFYGGSYALIGDDKYPNPDYWVSYIYKQLAGQTILKVTRDDNSMLSSSHEEVRVYAVCTKQSEKYHAGAVTGFGLTMNTTHSTKINFKSGWSKQNIDVYFIKSFGSQGLLSRWVSLNGKNLTMVDDVTMPTLTPQTQPASQGLLLPPLSLVFFVFPDAAAQACL